MKAYLEPEEAELLEKAATNLRDRLLIRLLFRLGCRISEALALRVEDIDFDQGTVTIEHLKARLRLFCPDCNARLGKTHTFCPRCGTRVEKAQIQEQEQRRIRTLPIDGGTLEMLKDYIRRGGPVSRGGSKLIFGINRHRAWQVVMECAERADLGALVNPETGKVHGVSPHRLRDAFAVMAVRRDDSTDSIRMLQEQLGHASIGTTMRYRKVAGQELKDWYPGFYNKAQSTVEALDVRWPLRNWLGAHFNDWAVGVAREEAREFGKAVANLFDVSFCTNCRRFIQPSITPKGQMACRCGNLIYPALDKELRPPKEIDDVLKLTLGALRDTRLTTDQYLEWKRTEIGAEN